MRPSPSRLLVAAALVPVLFGSLVLWSFGDRVERLDSVPAAVVNLDRPVHLAEGDGKPPVAAGRLLAGGLTSPDPGEESLGDAFAWQLTTPEDAERGLREGSYYAVVTIPRDFSRTVSGIASRHPSAARISVRSNDSSSALVGMVGDRVGDVAADRLGRRVTTTYLQGLYRRTDELGGALSRAERGADRLADGAVRLGEGGHRLSEGAGSLSGGLVTLADGADRLGAGAARLAAGGQRLAEGTDRLADGSTRLARGTGRLATGLDRLHERIRPLPRQTERLADGAGRVSRGVEGWSRVLRGWRQACQADPVLAGSHARLCAATLRAVGVEGENARALTAGSARVASGADALAGGTPRLVDAVGRAADGADRAALGADRVAGGARRLDTGAEALSRGASRLDEGAARLAGGAGRASDGAVRLAEGSSRLAGGTARLSNGSRQLATGLGRGAERVPDATPAEGERLAEVVADPVASASDRVNATSGPTRLAPGVLAMALWLGAFVSFLVRRALPRRALDDATSGVRVALAGWLPAVLLGAAQAALLLAVLGALGVTVASPAGLGLFLPVPVAVFAAVTQMLVAVLGPRRGWMAWIVVAALQAVSLGGLVPLATAPPLLQGLGALLPVPLAAEGIGRLVLGGQVGSVAVAVAGLVMWGVPAFTVTAWAARRRQRVTVADVRRRVGAAPG